MTQIKKKNNLVTKNDLKKAVLNLATKKDLEKFATKSDLWKLEDKVEALAKQVDHLPTKTEFYASQDKLMGELEIMREENIISTDMKRQVNDYEDRLETVEEKLGIPLAA